MGGRGKEEGEVEEGRDEKRDKGNAGEDSWGRRGLSCHVSAHVHANATRRRFASDTHLGKNMQSFRE